MLLYFMCVLNFSWREYSVWTLSQTAPSLAFCCLQNGRRQKAKRGVHWNEATETIFSLQQGTICSIVPRPQSQLFDHLQHGEGLGNFYMLDMNC